MAEVTVVTENKLGRAQIQAIPDIDTYHHGYLKLTHPDGYVLASLHFQPWLFDSCAMMGLAEFRGAEVFADYPYEFFAALYKIMDTHQRYHQYNFVYCVTDNQLKGGLAKLLSECGAIEMGSFANEAHGPSRMHLFRFNIKSVFGKYITNDGVSLKKGKVDVS